MSRQQPSRRDVLKRAAAMTAAAASLGGAGLAQAADMKGAMKHAMPALHAMRPRMPQIDAALQQSIAAQDVPGIVAMAASDRGIVYEGAFGVRDLAKGTAMTRDTVFRIASMTKAVTSVAAMQLVEQGKLTLNDPVPNIAECLSQPQVLDGFDAAGNPILRPAKRPITLRHLLTHTAGFTYEVWDANTQRYVKTTGMPSTPSGQVAALRIPLAFDPGDKWEYGVNLDWVGLIVEAISGQDLNSYFRDHIFAPLGMKDSSFVASDAMRARQASYHQRQPDGSLAPQPLETQVKPEFWAGGGGLYSTAPDYISFTQALLHGGTFGRARILKPETVALMNQNQIGAIEAGVLKSTTPARSADVDFFPGQSLKWGLAYMINTQAGPNGRSPGTLTWAGIFNTYYWIDPAKRVTGVFMTQTLPFAEPRSVKAYGAFENALYGSLRAV